MTTATTTEDRLSEKISVCPEAELPPGGTQLLEVDGRKIGVFNCDGALYAIEDRCSHDDGPLCMGNWDPETCVAFCPRHGASFDIKTGKALALPAYLPVRTFPVRVEDGVVKIDV